MTYGNSKRVQPIPLRVFTQSLLYGLVIFSLAKKD